MSAQKNGEQNKVKLGNIDLLDYFAGQVLVGNLANPEWLAIVTKKKWFETYPEIIAENCYDVAEAMLREREKRNGNENN